MKIVYKSDEKLVLKHVQDRWTVSLYAFAVLGFLALTTPSLDFDDSSGSKRGLIFWLLIMALFGLWTLISPSFKFHHHFSLKDELFLMFLIVFYFIGPSLFQKLTLVEFDKKKRTIVFIEQGRIERKHTVYDLDEMQSVKYREEQGKSYTLYGVELTLAERTIYFAKRFYGGEIPKNEYAQIAIDISNFINGGNS